MTRLYAIGDIHGQLDRLRQVHGLIAADRARTGDHDAPVIHLGDLVDRGPDSAGVIAYLRAGPARGGPWITLRGNHDAMFLRWLADPADRDPRLNPAYTWLHQNLGGRTTLASYGVSGQDEADLHAQAQARVPHADRNWLAGLPVMLRQPGLVFVHAGVRPGVPLDQQDEADLLWIRAPFVADRGDHGALIVHGHTPVDVATHYGNRVNLDTGAGYGRTLSVAVFEGTTAHLLTDSGRLPLAAA
jgi:serine/threonine protein phosphatase 1